MAPLPIPERRAVILVLVSKHQGSPGTCRFGSCFCVRASGPGVGSSEHLVQSTWSFQDCLIPEGCLSSASLLPGGLSWLPAAQHSTNKSMACALAAATGTWQGRRDFTWTQQEPVRATGGGVVVGFREPFAFPLPSPVHPRISAAAGTLLRCRKHWRLTCHSSGHCYI